MTKAPQKSMTQNGAGSAGKLSREELLLAAARWNALAKDLRPQNSQLSRILYISTRLETLAGEA